MRHAQALFLLLVCLASVRAGAATADSSRDSQAVIVQEEDIFTEISKQGIKLDGGEASIVNKARAAPAMAADTTRGRGDSTRQSTPTGATAAPAALPAEPLPEPGAPDGRNGKYGRYPGKYGPSGPQPAPSPSTDSLVGAAAEIEPVGPARVEDVKSINFAKNLKEYRSPKLAMFLSLLVPGLGQAYARNYWKTAIFGVLEAGIIGVSIAYNVRGDNQKDDAHAFAKKHYDPADTLFQNYYSALVQMVEGALPDSVEPHRRLDEGVFGWTDTTKLYIDHYRSQRRSGTEAYYSWVGEAAYVQGWDDCQPTFGAIIDAGAGVAFEVLDSSSGTTRYYRVHAQPDSAYLVRSLSSTDTSGYSYGYSPYQQHYNGMMSDANTSYRVSTNVLFLLLVNHIAAAIDAGITAKRHNDRLLGKQSFLHRIYIDQRLVNTGRQVVPGYAIRVMF
jgi:hypothetical protein